ncbi:MAG: signal peptidase II [Spirochaetaceae bacterium]|nr:signal peptidase II [Spirochaetaceae bacterium]
MAARKIPLAPLFAALAICLVDQAVKALVVQSIPLNSIAGRYFGDFLWIVHVRNTGAAFSFGAGAAPLIRLVVFVLLPLAVLPAALWFYFHNEQLPGLLRWAIGLMLGGGTGNLIDRIFRPEGVVDFISVRFYGLFGLERFPTFNVADSAITIGEVLLVLWVIFDSKGKAHAANQEKDAA